MSGNNHMTLFNSSPGTTFATFFLVTTNSGQDIGVAAGNNLTPGATSKAALFNVDSGETNYFMVFFTDQNGNFWQTQGEEANLDSGDTWSVTVTVEGSSPNMSMLIVATPSGGKPETFGPFQIFKVGTVGVAQAAQRAG